MSILSMLKLLHSTKFEHWCSYTNTDCTYAQKPCKNIYCTQQQKMNMISTRITTFELNLSLFDYHHHFYNI